MSEIKCPKCGETFKVDESGYIAIAGQVRDTEFQKELAERERLMKERYKNELDLVQSKSNEVHVSEVSEYKQEIERLKAQVASSETDKQIAIKDEETRLSKELHDRDLQISQLREQLKTKEQTLKSEKENELKLLEAKANEELAKQLSDYKTQIEKLKADKITLENEKTIIKKDEEIKGQLALVEKDKEISKLQFDLENANKNSELQMNALQISHTKQLKQHEELINYYKDLKARQSTKMIGETLEQHCEIEFNRLRATGFQRAYFEKDNDSRTGSKGDYIFKDFTESGLEYISIMFEMKNEMDETATKKTNEAFLKELDKDRNEKGCEYAVLVSLLEADNELYNNGIVDMSHKYPKMYVIRPQFFIPMITILRNAAINSIEYKTQLEEVKNQNIDISKFESEMLDFKDKFGKNYELASKKFQTAITEIDKTIDHLIKTKEALLSSENNLRLANNKAQDLSIKKLTRNNPTMKNMFAALPSISSDEE